MKKIRELRIEKKLTQKQLGNILNVAESTVSMWERGHRTPDRAALLKLADFFSVSLDCLLEHEVKEKAEQKKTPELLLESLGLNEENERMLREYLNLIMIKQMRDDNAEIADELAVKD